MPASSLDALKTVENLLSAARLGGDPENMGVPVSVGDGNILPEHADAITDRHQKILYRRVGAMRLNQKGRPIALQGLSCPFQHIDLRTLDIHLDQRGRWQLQFLH